MVAGVRGKESELGPALVDVGGGLILEAGDVMAPVTESAHTEGEAGPQTFSHGGVVGGAVPAPVDRIALSAHRRRAGEEDGLVGPLHLDQEVIDGLVVQEGVIVVHLDRVGTVVIDDALGGDAFAEVGLEAVHALVQQVPELTLVPGRRLGVGEVDDGHACLPLVPLPDLAVGALDEVPLLGPFLEEFGFLGNVGVDPGTDLEALLVEAGQHPFGVREGGVFPLEVAPFQVVHPATVEVEDRQGDVPLRHAVDELVDGLLVIVGGKGGRQPQTEAPVGDQWGFACQIGIGVEHPFEVLAANHRICQLLAGDGELDLGDLVGTDLEFHLVSGIHEDPIPPIAHIEGDVLVGLGRACATILVPDGDRLPILDEVGEALAQAVDLLSHTQVEGLDHVWPAIVIGYQGLAPPRRPCQRTALILVLEVDGITLGDLQGQPATGEGPSPLILLDPHRGIGPVKREPWVMAVVLPVVDDPGGDDVGSGGGDLDGKQSSVQGHAGIPDHLEGGVEGQPFLFDIRAVDIGRIFDVETVAHKPFSVEELHIFLSFLVVVGH